MMIAAGAIEPASDRERDAITRKSIDIAMVHMKDASRKKKNAPGSLRRFVMKYIVTLKAMAFAILYGMSVSIDAKASAEG